MVKQKGPKYPTSARGPSYPHYLSKLKRRRAWKRRVRGTPAQIGKAFPILEKMKLPPKIALKKPKITKAEAKRLIKEAAKPPRKLRATRKMVPLERITPTYKKLIKEKMEALKPTAIRPGMRRESYKVAIDAMKAAERWQAKGYRAYVDSSLSKIGNYVVVIFGAPVKSGGKESIYGERPIVSSIAPRNDLQRDLILSRAKIGRTSREIHAELDRMFPGRIRHEEVVRVLRKLEAEGKIRLGLK